MSEVGDYWKPQLAKADATITRLSGIIAEKKAEIERLREIEKAARQFVQEADDYPRYAPVKVWATPEGDPYLKLRTALGYQQLKGGAE